MKLVQPDEKPKTAFQSFKIEETKKEPFRFDQKKKFISAIAGSALVLLIFIIVVAVILGKSGKVWPTIIKFLILFQFR